MTDTQSVLFIIERIIHTIERGKRFMENNKRGSHGGWIPTRKIIYAGCYDCWSCEQDRIDAMEIPNAQLNSARTAGFIDIKSGNKEWTWNDEWFVTEAGMKLYEESKSSL